MEERTIYILLTRSGTWFSRLIHFATQDDYTHASIGLDGPDGPFYSFARKYRYLALPAGLLEDCGAVELPKPPTLLRPSDFCGLECLRPVHRGSLEDILTQPAA